MTPEDVKQTLEAGGITQMADGYGVCHACGAMVHPRWAEEHATFHDALVASLRETQEDTR